jgi:polysaccharide biosynthesis/export protein
MLSNIPSAGNFCLFLIALFCLGCGCLTSCTTPRNSTLPVKYFQPEGASQASLPIVPNTYVPIIQPNDLLSIVVGSLSPESNEIFNQSNQFTTSSSSGSSETAGYLVDQQGNIQLPLIGKVHVMGLSTQRAADTLRHQLSTYLREPTVNIRLRNFKVTVMGEVGGPNVYLVPDEKVSLPQLLSMAGDLTYTGRRENILVIREENGQQHYGRVDLSSREVFRSPFYYLHKNDIVYVEPTPAKEVGFNIVPNLKQEKADRAIRLVTVTLGTFSLLTNMILLFFR